MRERGRKREYRVFKSLETLGFWSSFHHRDQPGRTHPTILFPDSTALHRPSHQTHFTSDPTTRIRIRITQLMTHTPSQASVLSHHERIIIQLMHNHLKLSSSYMHFLLPPPFLLFLRIRIRRRLHPSPHPRLIHPHPYRHISPSESNTPVPWRNRCHCVTGRPSASRSLPLSLAPFWHHPLLPITPQTSSLPPMPPSLGPCLAHPSSSNT